VVWKNKSASLLASFLIIHTQFFTFREKEQEAKKKLLQNPIKMKKLEQLVKEREKQMMKKSKKSKKDKKKKKKGSSSDSSDSDDDLINKYLAIVREKEEKAGKEDKRSQETERERPRYAIIVSNNFMEKPA
jgi:hypothetical protein